jgi:hypothetical protein
MSEFSRAREIMAKELREDGGLMIAYRANIAMLLHDLFNKANFKDYDTRNRAADEIIKLVFFSGSGEETPPPKSTPRYMAPRCGGSET